MEIPKPIGRESRSLLISKRLPMGILKTRDLIVTIIILWNTIKISRETAKVSSGYLLATEGLERALPRIKKIGVAFLKSTFRPHNSVKITIVGLRSYWAATLLHFRKILAATRRTILIISGRHRRFHMHIKLA
jgi:hypothetical protein